MDTEQEQRTSPASRATLLVSMPITYRGEEGMSGSPPNPDKSGNRKIAALPSHGREGTKHCWVGFIFLCACVQREAALPKRQGFSGRGDSLVNPKQWMPGAKSCITIGTQQPENLSFPFYSPKASIPDSC